MIADKMAPETREFLGETARKFMAEISVMEEPERAFLVERILETLPEDTRVEVIGGIIREMSFTKLMHAINVSA